MSMRIFYDGGCPFCARYVSLVRLKRAVGEVELVDLRIDEASKRELEAEGFDLDDGMVVEMEGQRLSGAAAMHMIASMSTPSDSFNRLSRIILSNDVIAAAIYPLLRSGRWLTLFLLGREGLGAQDEGETARFTVFAGFFALFSFFHVFNYALEYQRFPPGPDQVAILAAAILVFYRPGSARALWLLMLASTISTIVQAPVSSNHTMVRTFVLLGYWASFLWAMMRGARWQSVFTNFVPAGRGTLLVMYTFGIFHKINTDFLNPESSCAVALWRLLPLPAPLLENSTLHGVAIYGTFLAEGLIMLALIVPRWRHIGIAFGIGFHLLLALSNYAMYISFTVLSVALHSLFLDRPTAMAILGSPAMEIIRKRSRNPVYVIAAIVCLAMLVAMAITKQYTFVTLLAMPLVLPYCLLVLWYGGASSRDGALMPPARAGTIIGLAVTGLFVINCLMPYAGLKSAQAINMFANLRLESGVSNHLVFSDAPGPFSYLEDVAVIVDDGGDPRLAWHREKDFAIVWYDLLVKLSENPDLTVRVARNGGGTITANASILSSEIEDTLHSAWIRKWFHFQPADLRQPEQCGM